MWLHAKPARPPPDHAPRALYKGLSCESLMGVCGLHSCHHHVHVELILQGVAACISGGRVLQDVAVNQEGVAINKVSASSRLYACEPQPGDRDLEGI